MEIVKVGLDLAKMKKEKKERKTKKFNGRKVK